MNIQNFNAIIIGTGQAGKPLATAMSAQGWNVAIIEKSLVGGTCINYGCTPTKTMIASARIAYLTGRSADFGVNHSKQEIDMPALVARKNKVVLEFRTGIEKNLESNPLITFIRGTASFENKNLVKVSTEAGEEMYLQSSCIVVNTGSQNKIPSIPGLDTVPFIDSTSAMDLLQVPEHLIILGGSYIAMEFGQLFLRLGSKVSIVEKAARILSREDEDVSEAMQKILEKEGMTFYLNSRIISVSPDEQHSVCIHLDQHGQQLSIKGSTLMVALGRSPQVSELNVQKAGIETDDRGYLKINEFLETNVKGIYALGDVNGGPAFTHISYDDYRILSHNLFNSEKKSLKGRILPYCVFTDPELGRTGMSEKEARISKINIRVARLPMTHVARAIESGQTEGFMKVIVDAQTDEILGASVLGMHGGEIAMMLHLAILGKLKYTLIRDSMFAHPTLAESLNNLFFAWEDPVK